MSFSYNNFCCIKKAFYQKAKKLPKVKLFGYLSNCDVSFKIKIKMVLLFLLQKCSKNTIFNLEIITSCHSIQNVTLHENLFVWLLI